MRFNSLDKNGEVLIFKKKQEKPSCFV